MNDIFYYRSFQVVFEVRDSEWPPFYRSMTLETREMKETVVKRCRHIFRKGRNYLTVLLAHKLQCARTPASRPGKNTEVPLSDQTSGLRSDALGQA